MCNVFTCKLLCYISEFWLIVFWPVSNVLSLTFKKDKDRKEAHELICWLKLVTYFLHCLLNETIKKVVTASRSLELSSPPNLACLMLHQCLCNLLNNFMLIPCWCVSDTLKRKNRKSFPEFVWKTSYLNLVKGKKLKSWSACAILWHVSQKINSSVGLLAWANVTIIGKNSTLFTPGCVSQGLQAW